MITTTLRRPVIQFRESRFYEQSPAEGRVDEQNAIIHNVRIIGPESRNGYVYSERALAQAIPLYEGCRVYVDHDHSGQVRSLSGLIGSLRNVRYQNGCVYGDLHLIKSHQMTAVVMEAARTHSKQFGLSHSARGSQPEMLNGIMTVDKIGEVESVDIVTTPATNNGLFESIAGDFAAEWGTRVTKGPPPDGMEAPDNSLGIDYAKMNATVPKFARASMASADGDDADESSGEYEAALAELDGVVAKLKKLTPSNKQEADPFDPEESPDRKTDAEAFDEAVRGIRKQQVVAEDSYESAFRTSVIQGR